MEKPRKAALANLYNTATNQYGFFTTKQAESAGFSRKTHLYHVRAGNWIREHRAVYRLAQFPPQDRPDLMLWFLWSRNREDKPQGAYSHETALTLYDLSDVMPRKLHMTVPKRFRKNTPIPRALVLHRADLVPTDIETIHGVQVTGPLRTISDLLVEGRVSKDLILQALREGLRRGLITRPPTSPRELPASAAEEPSLLPCDSFRTSASKGADAQSRNQNARTMPKDLPSHCFILQWFSADAKSEIERKS